VAKEASRDSGEADVASNQSLEPLLRVGKMMNRKQENKQIKDRYVTL
jgi:hypothetical protein